MTTIENEFNKMFKELRDKANIKIQESFRKIFDKYPSLESFSWVGFVPYFNDGDECVWGLVEYYGELNDERVNPDSFYSHEFCGDSKTEEWYKNNKWAKGAVKDCWEIIYSIPRDILKTIYGDHVKVTMYRNGTTNVEEFTEHD